MIQNILEVDGHVQGVALLTRSSAAAAALWSNCRGSRSTNCWTTSRSGRGLSGGFRCRSVAVVNDTKCKRAADTKVNYESARRLTVVTRNDHFARQRRQVEVAKTRAPDRRQRAIRIRCGKAGSLIQLSIDITIETSGNVESRPGVRDDKR